MRIISGKLKGRTLYPGKSFTARPTTDFAKSGLFNILQNEVDFENSTVADVFSGSGSIGFEFYSRGAKKVVCIENSPVHCAFIQENIKKFQAAGMQVIRFDGYDWAKRNREPFHIIFADPPYTDEHIEKLPDLILKAENLIPDGLFILEHNDSLNFETHPNFYKSRSYGKVHFTFFKFH